MPGSQADGDEGKALARCEGNRQPYVDAVRKARAPEVDKDWVATLAIADTWAKNTRHSEEQPGARDRTGGRIDFGGMFGIGEGGSFSNAVTGGQSCPAGYTPYEIKGTFNVD